MTFKPALLGFITGQTLGSGTFQAVPGWQEKAFIWSNDTLGGNPGFFRFDFSTGAIEQAITNTALAVPAAGPPFTLDGSGQLYMPSVSGNYRGYAQVRGRDFAYLAAYGDSSTFANYPNGVPAARSLTPLTLGNGTILAGGSLLNSDQVVWLDWATPGAMGFGGFTGDFGSDFGLPDLDCVGAPGPQTGSLSTAFFITGPRVPGTGDKLVLRKLQCDPGIYGYNIANWPVETTSASFDLIGTVLPADIDATWTHIFHSGLCYDATDGNLLAQVGTSDAVTATAYIVKLLASDATVMWKVPVAATNPDSTMMAFSRIRHGVYCYLTTNIGGNEMVVIDTAAGTATTYTDGLAGLSAGSQAFDDTTGAIFAATSFTQTTGSPTLLGSTPSSFSLQWALLYAIQAFNEPVLPLSAISYTRIWGSP